MFFTFGINHHSCPVYIRERLCFDGELLSRALKKGKEQTQISELVILSTCNRVEFYGVTNGSQVPCEALYAIVEGSLQVSSSLFRPYIEIKKECAAILHIFRVAAGLESMVLGENEILGQLRNAFQEAVRIGTVHSKLFRLMEKALKIGKDVRTKTRINEGATGIPSVAIELAKGVFGSLKNKEVMVLGTGTIGIKTLSNLRQAAASVNCIVSRNETQGRKVASKFDTEWLSYSADWLEKLQVIDILITSTSTIQRIITKKSAQSAMLGRASHPLLLIDLAVPRDIGEQVKELDNVHLYNIDDLKHIAEGNLDLRQKEIRAANLLVEKAVTFFVRWLAQREGLEEERAT